MLINKIKHFLKQPWQLAAIIVLVSFFSLTAWRIFNLSIVHDEALSLELFSYLPLLDIVDPLKTGDGNMMANNHVLNTVLMKLGRSIFGYQEYAVRLAAWLATIIYLLSVYLISRLIANKKLALAFIILMCSNPFVLDFLALARGYGLAVALMLLSCYYLFSFKAQEAQAHKILLSFLAAALAVLANFVMSYFFASLFVVWFIRLFSSYQRPIGLVASRLFLSSLPSVIVVYVFAWPQINYMASHGTQYLFFGGTAGLWLNTVASLISATLYHGNYNTGLNVLLALEVLLVLIIAIFWSLRLIKQARLSRPGHQMFFYAVILLFTNALLVVINHSLTKALFPIDRAALWLLVLFYLMFASMMVSIWTETADKKVVWFCAIIVFLALTHLVGVMKPNRTYVWPYCQDAQRVYRTIIETINAPTKLVTSWELMPSFFFYFNKFDSKNLHYIITDTNRKPQAGSDIYLLLSTDYDVIKRYQLNIVRDKSTDSITYAVKP